MDQLFWMLIGAGGLAGLILIRLAARHGYAWVSAQMKARAAAAEAELRSKVSAAGGDLGPWLATLEREAGALPVLAQRRAHAEADIAALKAKKPVAAPGGTPSSPLHESLTSSLSLQTKEYVSCRCPIHGSFPEAAFLVG